MGSGGNEFGDGVSESGVRADVENGKGVFAVIHTTIGENDGNEVDAGIFQKRR